MGNLRMKVVPNQYQKRSGRVKQKHSYVHTFIHVITDSILVDSLVGT